MTALGPTPLVLAAPGDRVLSGVLRKLRLLAARNLLTLPARAVPGDVAVRLPGLQAGLAAALRRSPDAVLAAVGDPDVLPRLLMLAGGPGAPEAHLRAAVPALLGAIDGVAVPEPLVWDLPIAALPTPSAGRLVRFDPPARVRARRGPR